MLKLLLIVVILFLLRNELRCLKPHWHTVLPAAVGAVIGYVWASFLARFGILAQVHREVGIAPGLFMLISCLIGAGCVSSWGRPFLRRLFPPSDKDGTDVSR